jgi:hypothetical protein
VGGISVLALAVLLIVPFAAAEETFVSKTVDFFYGLFGATRAERITVKVADIVDGNGGTASDSVFIAINSVSVPDFTVPFLFKQRQNGLEAIYTFMIKNIGEKAPDEIPWRLDAGDGIVKTGVIKDKKLNVGESMTVAEKVIYKAPGGKTVIVLVNPDGTEPELDNGNNEKGIDVVI